MTRTIAVLLVLVGSVAAANAQHPIHLSCLSNENLRHYRVPGSPQLSPDGHRVVFTIREGAARFGVSHLWWADTTKPESARQITFSQSSDHVGESNPRWMPDGSSILFLAKRGKHRRIYRLPATGGEASPLKMVYHAAKPATTQAKGSAVTSSPSAGAELDVTRFEISPDGKWLAVLAKEPDTPEDQKRKKEKRDAVIVDQDLHPMRVWLYLLAGGSLTPLTSKKREAVSAAWSPDSAKLAIVTRPPGNSDDLGPRHQLEVVSVVQPHATRLVSGISPTVDRVFWSPSGRQFAYFAASRANVPPGVDDLYTIPVSGGTAKDVAPGTEFARGALMWSHDGSSIFAEIQKGTTVGLARVNASGGQPEPLDTGLPVNVSFATNRSHSGFTFIAQASNRPPEVMFIRSFGAGQSPLRMSRTNPEWPDSGWAQARPVEWTAPDGLTIHGLMFLPPPAGCSRKPRHAPYPLVVSVHGGPTGAFLQSFSPFAQLLVAQGWAVLEPNPRGSTGYGMKFVAVNQNDLGDKDYGDIMSGFDWALAHEPVDPHRAGLYGYSYGGEMAGFVEGRTTRFRAIVAGAPVIDQYSEYGTEDGSWYDRWFFGQPWKRPSDAWRQSPLSRAADAHTPFLLLQGEADTTDPLGQSEEMYRALRQDRVPVEMIKFPRENHGGLGGGIAGYPSKEPWHGFEARRHILEWFHSHFSNPQGASSASSGRH